MSVTTIALLATLAQANDSAVAFLHVNLIRTDRAAIDRDRAVVVRGDRIISVGPTAEARLGPDTQRIDATGKFLLPGFADMHVHLGREEELVTFIANGVTTVRNMWGEPRHVEWRRRIAAGSLLGPRIVTAGPIIDGTPPSVPAMLVVTDPAKAREVVESQSAAGYDFVKIYNSVPGPVYDSIRVVARELGMPVAGHVPFDAGLFGVLRGGQQTIEHLRGYVAELVPPNAPVQPGASLKSRSVAWNYLDPSRIAAVVDSTVRSGAWNCPTLMVTGELLAPPEQWEALARRPILKYLGPAAAGDRAAIPYLRDFTAVDYREAVRGITGQRQLVRAIDSAGGRILAGTDSYLSGFAFQLELLELERAGLSRWRVLMIATAEAARFFGESGDWGQVAPGQRADLQLIDGDPLRSLAALDRRSGVMVRGRWYPAAELRARLDALAASFQPR
jgi:hypothetical protein